LWGGGGNANPDPWFPNGGAPSDPLIARGGSDNGPQAAQMGEYFNEGWQSGAPNLPKWEGGYNFQTGLWEAIVYRGVTYQPFKRNELDQYYNNGDKAGKRFEAMALQAFGKGNPTGFKVGPSPVDAIEDVKIVDNNGKVIQQFNNANLYEVYSVLQQKNKIVRQGVNNQMLGYLNFLASQKSAIRANVASFFHITTANIQLNQQLINETTKKGINLFQSVAYKDPVTGGVLFTDFVGINWQIMGAAKYNSLYGRWSPTGIPFINFGNPIPVP